MHADLSSVPPPLLIDTRAALTAWVQALSEAPWIAVDTESDSFHSYKEKVCLVQMTANGRDAVIDPLAVQDLTPLQPVFVDPRRIKVFHDAVYDLLCLRRDFGFDFHGIFDTVVASRLLGERDFGLAAVLLRRFGITVDKHLQRSDWARRPLSAAQLVYAQLDTHFLPELAEQLKRELQQRNRWRWAEEEFARLPDLAVRLGSRRPVKSADGFWRLPGVRALSPMVQGRARALHLAREAIAARLNRPAFKVFGDRVILDMSLHPPPLERPLAPRPGLRRAGAERFGNEILRALKGARPVTTPPPAGTSRRRRGGRLRDPAAKDRYESLRADRARRAEEIGVDPEVLIGNAALEDLALRPPDSAEELFGRPDFRGWRRELLAESIWKILASAKM